MKPCRYCGSTSHYATFCFQRPKKKLESRKPLQVRKPLRRSSKPIRQAGKTTSRWIAFRSQYLKDHPPAIHGGYDFCGICRGRWGRGWVHESVVTLDHIVSRGRDKSRIYDPTNIQKAHPICNDEKGSMSMEEYEERVAPKNDEIYRKSLDSR